jgi:hypothetical protein
MNGAKFENWLKEIIPMMQMEAGNLQPVLILDNAPYHCRIDESTRVPRVKNNSRKGQMIDWLEERGISVPKICTRAILDEMIEKITCENPHLYNRRIVEGICRSAGIEVLWLPPYHCELNPIEMVWAQLKNRIREKSKANDKLDAVISLGREVLESISNETVKKIFDHVQRKEEWFLKIDPIIEVEPFIINLEDDFDDDSDSDEFDE